MYSCIRFCNILSMRMFIINYNVSYEVLKRLIVKVFVFMFGMNILKVSVWNILVEMYKYCSIYFILCKRFNCYYIILIILLVLYNLYVLLKFENCVLLFYLVVFSLFI